MNMKTPKLNSFPTKTSNSYLKQIDSTHPLVLEAEQTDPRVKNIKPKFKTSQPFDVNLTKSAKHSQ